MDKSKHEHNLNVKISPDVDGNYVAQVVEIPSIVVQCDTKEKLKDEITLAMDSYFRVHPEEHERLLQMEKGIKEISESTTFEQMTIVA
jgi:predicted RNase H-like HicB family nuclease